MVWFRTWTNSYKEMLEGLASGNEKTPAVITDYKDYNTDKTVKFIVQMSQVNSFICRGIYDILFKIPTMVMCYWEKNEK